VVHLHRSSCRRPGWTGLSTVSFIPLPKDSSRSRLLCRHRLLSNATNALRLRLPLPFRRRLPRGSPARRPGGPLETGCGR
jgi:hypothetical protein